MTDGNFSKSVVALYTLYVILTVTPPVIFTVMNTLSHNMMVDALLHYMREDDTISSHSTR